MIRLPPRSTRTDTLFPYPTLFRSPDRLVSGERRRLRLYAEVVGQPAPQRFIDAERGSRLAAVGENLHERAAGFLVVRVEQQKLPRDGGTALALAGGQRSRQGAGHGFRRQMAQPLPPHQQPLLATGVGRLDPLQQIAAVEDDGAVDALRGALDRKSTRLNSSH